VPSSPDIAVQLYTVRSALASDPDATLERLARIGFRIVEPFDLLRYRDALREGLPRFGLSARTAHADVLVADRDAVFEAAAELGIATVIQPWLEPTRFATADGIAGVASDLAAAADRAAASGLAIGYHNHHFELESRIDSRHALEVLADALPPSVSLEVDTYWALVGGADVPALLRRLGERVIALHLKDGDGSLDTKRQVPLGTGRLPVREILAAAPSALRVLELDDTTGDLFDAVRVGRDLLVELAGA
jgi:sugar phosphate isomerase/epimerase